MKIKNKLTLLFTLIVALLLIVLNFYIYSLSKAHTTTDFFNQIKERAFNTANVFLEQDEESQKVYTKFKEKYLERLPDEIIRVYNSENKPVFISDSVVTYFPYRVIERTREEKIYQFKDGDRYVCGIFYIDNQGEFVILASAIDKYGDERLNHLRNVLMIGFFVSLVIVFFMGRFLTKQMLLPISGITKQVNAITETNLHFRLNEGNGKDEIAELAKTFNDLLGRLENAFELQQSFVANASHELRTPLTSIIGNIDVTLSKQRGVEEYKSILNTILEEAERLHKLSDGLLNIAQASFDNKNLKLESIRIDELLEEAKDIVQNQISKSSFDLNFENMPEQFDQLIIKGNKNLLMIAFENIFENASKFSENRNVKIYLQNSDESMQIIVQDSGIGIPKKDLVNVLQTFYRSENARSFAGSGIGLSLSQKIILLHNGKLIVQSIENKGTVVTVTFPKVKNY